MAVPPSTIYFNQITENDFSDYMVMVTHAGSGLIVAGISTSNTFSLGSGADIGANAFSTMTAEGGWNMAGKVEEKITGGTNFTEAAKEEFLSHSSTVKTYKGPTDSSFSVSFKVFPGKFRMGSYSSMEAKLAKLTQPDEGVLTGSGWIKSSLYSADKIKDIALKTGFITDLDSSLLSVSIGKWFSTPTVLHCTNIDRGYSTYVDTKGSPLFMDLTMSFTAYRALTPTELASWIKV